MLSQMQTNRLPPVEPCAKRQDPQCRLRICGFLTLILSLGSLQLMAVSPVSVNYNLHKTLPSQASSRQVIVGFKPSATQKDIENLLRHLDSDFLPQHSGHAKFRLLSVPRDRGVEDMIARLRASDVVDFAEPDYGIGLHSTTPADPLFVRQWHLQAGSGSINLREIRQSMKELAGISLLNGSPTVIVAMADAGVTIAKGGPNRRAGDLAGATYTDGYDFVHNDMYPDDDHGHGTHIAGIIAQTTDNRLGAASPAGGVSLMPLKVADAQGRGLVSSLAQAVYFAADHGAAVLNISMGGSDSSYALHEALRYGDAKGMLIVCSAGNDGDQGIVSYPAAFKPYCLAVAACNAIGEPAPYSSRGSSIDLCAPGGDVTVDLNKDGYPDGILQQGFNPARGSYGFYYAQGTSCAAALVSAVAALIISRQHVEQRRVPGAQIREALLKTADDRGLPGWDELYGWGMVNPVAALNYDFTQTLRHDAAVSYVPALSSFAVVGQNVSICIELTNRGTHTDTFSVWLIDRTSRDTLQHWSSLLSMGGRTTTLTTQWSTVDSRIGMHELEALVTIDNAVDENPADNQVIQIVEIKHNSHDVAVSRLDAADSVSQGEMCEVTVRIANNGSYEEPVTVLLHGLTDNVVIGSKDVTVAVAQTLPVIFSWKTGQASPGLHILEAEASLTYDHNLSDNKNRTGIHIIQDTRTPMHVGDIALKVHQPADRTRPPNSVDAAILVVDRRGTPVDRAWVTLRWSGAIDHESRLQCNDAGIAYCTTPDLPQQVSPTTPFICTVVDVRKEGFRYIPAGNVMQTNKLTLKGN